MNAGVLDVGDDRRKVCVLCIYSVARDLHIMDSKINSELSKKLELP